MPSCFWKGEESALWMSWCCWTLSLPSLEREFGALIVDIAGAKKGKPHLYAQNCLMHLSHSLPWGHKKKKELLKSLLTSQHIHCTMDIFGTLLFEWIFLTSDQSRDHWSCQQTNCQLAIFCFLFQSCLLNEVSFSTRRLVFPSYV